MRQFLARNVWKSYLWLLIALSSSGLVFNAVQAAHPSFMSAHVVVQFTENIADPSSPEFIDDLATRVGAPLAYVRQAGANGHLLLIRHLQGKDQLNQVMSALEGDQSIVAVKPRGRLEPEQH